MKDRVNGEERYVSVARCPIPNCKWEEMFPVVANGTSGLEAIRNHLTAHAPGDLIALIVMRVEADDMVATYRLRREDRGQ
jgi:hypothetical protein